MLLSRNKRNDLYPFLHLGYFENRILLKLALGAYVASQIIVLRMKRLNQTESPIFVIVYVLCFQRQSLFSFILLFKQEDHDGPISLT